MRLVEMQYLRTTITEEQRQEFAALIEDTVQQIEPVPSRLGTEAGLIRGTGGGLVGAFDELATKHPPVLPKLNPRRALFFLSKIDDIPAWEQRVEANRDTKFVEVGRYLICADFPAGSNLDQDPAKSVARLYKLLLPGEQKHQFLAAGHSESA